MKDVLDKLTSYNIFNYLLPGVVFIILSNILTNYSLWQTRLVFNAFAAYFIGLVISRFGSLIVEPILKRVSFLTFYDYSDFVSACKKDTKIEVLSEVNNMYRTFSSLLILILLLKIYELIELNYPILKNISSYMLIILMLIMFLYSYKKQTRYIAKRIKSIRS